MHLRWVVDIQLLVPFALLTMATLLAAVAMQAQVAANSKRKSNYGADANSALNRNAGASHDAYLRLGQLMGLTEQEAVQAAQSAPVRAEPDAGAASLRDLKPERAPPPPTYEDFEAALKKSGRGAVRRMSSDAARPPAPRARTGWPRPSASSRGRTPTAPPASS